VESLAKAMTAMQRQYNGRGADTHSDGGGVRALAALVILQRVMDKASPGKKPCEVFDLIGSTSTGR